MTTKQNISPRFEWTAFVCPHCWDLTSHEWAKLENLHHPEDYTEYNGEYWDSYYSFHKSTCKECEWICLRYCEEFLPRLGGGEERIEEKMIFPWWCNESTIPAHPDMPKEIKKDYAEAAAILDNSPRWSCAILRLALEKLLDTIIEKKGQDKKDINKSIAYLIWEGVLSERLSKMMDAVRVIGNWAIHPWVLDLKDTKQTALKLFSIFNYIVEELISRPKREEELFWMIPDPLKEWIEKRNKWALKKQKQSN